MIADETTGIDMTPDVVSSDTASPAEDVASASSILSNNVLDIKTKSIFSTPIVKGIPISHEHWRGYFVPYGYDLTRLGLGKTSEEKQGVERICGPIYAIAETSSPDGLNGGLVLEFQNSRDEMLTISIPRSRLHEEPRLLATELADRNFRIITGKEKELCVYLSKCDAPERRMAATQTGWAASEIPDELVYVLPDRATKPGYHFQPERNSSTQQSVTSRGTLADWMKHVFEPGPYPLFAVLAALSGPVLKFAGMESGGFHFYGGSSSGKTTLAQIAASTFGNGSDPADAPSSPYTKRWNSTANAIEGLASGHNDMPLVLDELGSCNSRDYSRMIYDLSGGQGKSAMDANRNMRKQRAWTVSIISTGEVSSQSKIEESLSGNRGGRTQAKAGQMIRLIDIMVKQSMFLDRQQVDKIKRSCAVYYGTLGPAFIESIVRQYKNGTSLRLTIQATIDEVQAELISMQSRKLDAFQERALKRFALAKAVGLLLLHSKIIPTLTRKDVDDCIDTVVADWMPFSVGLSDAERAITSLREFILKYRDARFKDIKLFNSKDKLNREIAGYIDDVLDVFFMLPAGFREATNAEPRITARALRERGFLKTDQADRLTCRTMIDGNNITGYCIKASLLGADTDE